MNQIYKAGISAFLALACFVQEKATAQCACANGDPIDSVVQVVTLNDLSDPNTVVPFQKFDPTMGLLSCVRMRAQFTTIMDIDFINRETFDVADYLVNYNRISTVLGPSGGGISGTSTWNKDYGPFLLTANPGPSPDSTVHFGPETVYSNTVINRSTTNVVPYTGVGTVNFTYINTGGFTILQGSSNMGAYIAVDTDITLRLSYYWCPLIVLPSGMKLFSVVRKDNQVSLRWKTENEKISNKYTIEYSRDGAHFTAMDTKQAMAIETAQYEYLFMAPASETGKIYFRVRQTNAAGKSALSEVKMISFSNNGALEPSVYPNPARKQVQLQFQSPQSGNLQIELVNTLGQVMEHQKQRVSRAVTTQVNFGRTHTQGVYWLRVLNTDTGEQSVTRLTIEH